jgi:hypothetical protein
MLPGLSITDVAGSKLPREQAANTALARSVRLSMFPDVEEG